MAVIGGETVVQTQDEDRCPECAVGAVAQGNAQRVYEPSLPKTLRGMDPRIQSGLGAMARLPEAVRAEVHRQAGLVDLGEPLPEPTPEPLPDVEPVFPRSLPISPSTPALPAESEEDNIGDHQP